MSLVSLVSSRDNRLVKVAPMLATIHDWRALLQSAVREEELQHFRNHGRTGRPPGNARLVERLERIVGRTLSPRKRGRKPKLRKRSE